LICAAALLGGLAPSAARAIPGEAYAEFTHDGGWCWFADPRALICQGKTYCGWVTSNGSIQIGVLDHTSGKITTTTLHEKFQKDDHDTPTFFSRPDGRLMAFYSRHSGVDMYARITKRPNDASEWEPERTLQFHDGPRPRKDVTYPTPISLSDEAGTLYMFWRGDSYKPTVSKSTDAGDTWSTARVLIMRKGADARNRPYFRVASNSKDRIHFVFTDGHPRNEPTNSVYYACYKKGAFYKADGTRIAGWDQLPIEPSAADRVYDASQTLARAWVWDIAEDRSGRPVIAYVRFPSDTDHRYHYARWDGQAWRDTEIVAAGRWFPRTPAGQTEPEPNYSGGLILDHADPSIVYLSRPVKGVFEIEKWTTSDGGATWQSKPITANSRYDNVRPFVVRDQTSRRTMLLWMNNYGGYVHFTNYLSSIRMSVEEQ
jgi:hypothetical protein